MVTSLQVVLQEQSCNSCRLRANTQAAHARAQACTMSQCGCHWTRWLRKGSTALVWNHSLLASLEYCVAASRRSQAAEFLSLEGWHWTMQAVPVRFCLCPVSLSCTPSCDKCPQAGVQTGGQLSRVVDPSDTLYREDPAAVPSANADHVSPANRGFKSGNMRCDQRKPPFDSSHVREKPSSGLPTRRNGGLRRIGQL